MFLFIDLRETGSVHTESSVLSVMHSVFSPYACFIVGCFAFVSLSGVSHLTQVRGLFDLNVFFCGGGVGVSFSAEIFKN